MSYGREHLYNELFGGDVIVPDPCPPVKIFNYKKDHVNCKDICCVTNLKPKNNKTCLRSCCNKRSQKTKCSSAFCPICNICKKCYCYCECFCYHACHIQCCQDDKCDPCNSCEPCEIPKEVLHCTPIFKKALSKHEKYYCNPYFIQDCVCGRKGCMGGCK